MSTGPIVCPHCYKNVYSAAVAADGLIHCDACGHAFPANSGTPFARFGQGPASFGAPPQPGSSVPKSGTFGANPGNSPSNHDSSFPKSGISGAPVGAAPPPSGPSMFGCLMVVLGAGALLTCCCGGVGALVFVQARQAAQQPVAQQPNVVPFNPPTAIHPEFPPPIDPFEFPSPIDPNDLPSEFVVPSARWTPPGTSAAKGRSLDQVLADLSRTSGANPDSTGLIFELRNMQVDNARRREVVQALLQYCERASIHTGSVAKPALEKWASAAESPLLAKFAAGKYDSFVRRSAVEVIAKNGGDAETAKLLAGLLGDVFLHNVLKEALQKIGPAAESALLDQLAQEDLFTRHRAFQLVGEIGGAKSVSRLQRIIDQNKQPDALLARHALSEIERRGARAQ